MSLFVVCRCFLFVGVGHLSLFDICRFLSFVVREGVNEKKTFSFGHCPNYLNPPPHPPIRAPWSFFSGRQKRRFARMMEKNTDDDNNRCHDNFDQNFGNFDDNDDKNY